MLDIYTVAFFGHRYIDNPLKIEELLEEQIRKLIDENEYVEFLVGHNGDFDRCVSSAVLIKHISMQLQKEKISLNSPLKKHKISI